MKAASMAGGFGTRLRPPTAHMVTPFVAISPDGPAFQSYLLTCPRCHVVAKGEGAERARALAEEFRGRMAGWTKELA
jgi:hypothetical protein